VPHRQQSAEVKAHETGVARYHDAIGLAISINQTRCGVCLQRGDRLPLLRRECARRFDLFHERTDNRPDVVIEDRRKIRITIA